MDSKPEEEIVQNEYQMMDAVTTPAVPSMPTVPTPPTPAAATDPEIPVYSPGIEPMMPLPPVEFPDESPAGTTMDVLVALATTARFATGVILVVTYTLLWNVNANPGANYMIAGIFLFASFVAQYIAKDINMISFGTGLTGSFIIIIGGIMAFDRNNIDAESVGMMWIIASLFLAASHSYDLVVGYIKDNIIIRVSKIAAIVGAVFFAIGGITMFSLGDNLNQGTIFTFADDFLSGGIAYSVHAICMANGHKVVLDRVFKDISARQQ